MIKDEVLPAEITQPIIISHEDLMKPDDLLRKQIIKDFVKRMQDSGLIVEATITAYLLDRATTICAKQNISRETQLTFSEILNSLIEEFLNENGETLDLKFLSFLIISNTEHELTNEKTRGIDHLTRLPQRLKLEEDFNHILEGHRKGDTQPFSLIIIDIDFFKPINDNFGHLAGDLILKSVARILEEITRGEEKAYRYGGDEFIIIAKGNHQEVEFLLKRIVDYFKNNPINGEDSRRYRISVSLGSASSDKIGKNEMDLETFIRKADEALYVTKSNGRNGYTQYQETGAKEPGLNFNSLYFRIKSAVKVLFAK